MKQGYNRPDILCRLLLICALVPVMVRAQTTQTVTWVIKDGEVRRNGEVVPASEWPQGMDIEGVVLSFSVSDESAGYFRGADRRLYAVTPRSLGLAMQADMVEDVWLQMSVTSPRGSVSLPQGATAATMMEGLQQSTAVAAALSASAAEVQAQYSLQVGQYLKDVQEANLALYANLKDEWRLELETAELAHDIRRLSEGEERRAKVLELRKGLESIFELKQQNRRQEVAYLEAEIAALRARLRARQKQKGALVEARLRELVPNSQ